MRFCLCWAAMAVVLLLGGAVGICAAKETTPSKALSVKAENVKSEPRGTVRVTTYTHAEVRHSDAVLTAETVVQRSEESEHQFVGMGSAQFTDLVSAVTAAVIVLQPMPTLACFTGAVKMVITPRKISEQAAPSPITITADAATYNYDTRQACFTGHVTMVQDQRTIGTGATVTYSWQTGEYKISD